MKKKLQKQRNVEDKLTGSTPKKDNSKSANSNDGTREDTSKGEMITNKNYVMSLIDDKLKQLSSVLIDKMTNIMHSKLSQVNDEFKSIAGILETMNENYKSFKDALKNNLSSTNNTSDIKVIMNKNRDEQLLQERERKLRASNIVIQGVNEGKQEDKDYISLLLKTLGVHSEPESITRLGKSEPNKNRLLKIKVNSVSDKNQFMSRLSNLKNVEDRFRKINVTDDYTLQEREEIRRWVDKAKEKNLTEKVLFIWKVRETPKNGLHLARIGKH